MQTFVSAVLAAALLGIVSCGTGRRPAPPEEELLRCTHYLLETGTAGLRPDASARYRLPYDESVPRRVAQGPRDDEGLDLPDLGSLTIGSGRIVSAPRGARGRSHRGSQRNAFDFEMPPATDVLAARSGTVSCVLGNSLTVLHEDGTVALYGHLSEAVVAQGDEVREGQMLARSGGGPSIPHLHFAVLGLGGVGSYQSLPIRFDDGSPDGYVPVTGRYYGSGRLVDSDP